MNCHMLCRQMFLFVLTLVAMGCAAPPSPTPLPTDMPSPTLLPTDTPTLTPTFTPTATQTPTATLTPTSLPTDTPMPTVTHTRTLTPTDTLTPTLLPTATRPPVVCAVKDGSWAAEGGTSFLDSSKGVQLTVSRCTITRLIHILNFSGEGLIISLKETRIPIRNNQFFYEQPQNGGTYSIRGTFTSSNVKGSWTMTKGATILGSALQEDATGEWSAVP